MHMDFRDLHSRYEELREQFDAGEINEEEFKEELESLQLKDEQGRYWTIGAQTGKWYFYDGRRWVEETPLPMTKHEGRGMPEFTSVDAAEREPRRGVPRWLSTGCAGLLVLLVVAGLIVGGMTYLRGQEDAVSQVATPTLSLGIPASTPTLGPTPSPSPTLLPTDTPAAAKQYSNSAFGFSLQYPGAWEVKESRQQVVLAPDAGGLSASLEDEQAVIEEPAFVVGHQIETISDEPSQLLTQLVAQLPTDAATVETGSRTIEGVRWVISQVNLNSAESAEQMTAYVAATFQNGLGYTVLAAAPAADWETFSPIFQQMFDSFQFTEPQVAAVLIPTATVSPTQPITATSVLAETTPGAPGTTPTPVVYLVAEGDTLGAIAARFDVSVEEIMAANDLDDSASLSIGQELVIPIEGSAPLAVGAATPSAESPSETPTEEALAAAAATPAVAAEAEPTPVHAPAPAPAALSGKIVFPVYNPNRMVADQVGSYDIWMSDTQGNIQLLMSEASQPALSPGGDLLAYRSWLPSGRGVAFITLGGGRGDLLTGFLEDGLPTWAPDSITIAFASRREGDRVSRIFRVNQVDRTDRGLGLLGEYVSAFRDGRLVYKGCTPEGACGMLISGPEGGEYQMISNNTSDTAPAPSPDGARIAFMSRERDGAGNWEIFVMSSGGGEATRLTSNGANDGLPAWSPDGSTLAFASDRDGVWAIWAMSPDGSNQRKLFNMGGSPDGIIGFDINNSRGWLEERISWGP